MYQVLLCPLTMITVSCSSLILNLYQLIEYTDIKRWKFGACIVTSFNVGASFEAKLDWVPRGRNWQWNFVAWDNQKSLWLYSQRGCSDYSFQPHHYGLLHSRWGCLNNLHRIKMCFVASESRTFVIEVEMQAKLQSSHHSAPLGDWYELMPGSQCLGAHEVWWDKYPCVSDFTLLCPYTQFLLLYCYWTVLVSNTNHSIDATAADLPKNIGIIPNYYGIFISTSRDPTRQAFGTTSPQE